MEILNESMELDTFEYHISKQSYFNKSINTNNVRHSLDYGYESFISSASFNLSKHESQSHGDYNFSQPSTPVKKMTVNVGTGQSTTPNRNLLYANQSYVADVSGMYLASVSSSYQSPFKLSSSSSISQYSTSSSNSPIGKLTQSPKFVLNTDNYLNERDDVKTKLLRSPAFKLTNSNNKNPSSYLFHNSERPVVRSFSSRFNNYTSEPITSSTILTTPTQEEFIERLVKNKLMPDNPEFLIGRRMGIEYVDVLAELNQRSMNNVLDLIYSNLGPSDFVKIACVSKQWRQIIKQNPKLNEKRLQHIKLRRKIFFNTKENRTNDSFTDLNDSSLSLHQQPIQTLNAKDKREAFKRIREKTYAGAAVSHESEQQRQQTAFVFASLDLNCINNLNSKYSSESNSSLASRTIINSSNSLADEFLNTMRQVNRNIQNKAKSQLEKEFRRISIDENLIQNKIKTQFDEQLLSTGSSTSAIPEDTQILIAKKLKQQSPVKKSPRKLSQSPHKFPISPSPVKQNKIELICSKKSKKNLKRL